MSNYWEQLKDPRWQKVRLKKLEAAEWVCQRCWCDDTMLSVHHKRYVKGRKPWEYQDHELVVLCQPCHESEHALKDLQSELISRLDVDGPASVDDFFSVAAGYIHWQSVDEGLQNASASFAKNSPFQFASGAMLANLLGAFRFTISGLSHVIECLNESESDLKKDLQAVFEKHRILVDPSKQGFRGLGSPEK